MPGVGLQTLWGLAAGLCSVIAIAVYVADVVRGHTRPNKVTWWVFGLLNVALSVSYFAAGARETVWLPASYGLGFLFVGILSLRYGEGGWTPLDRGCLAGAILGLLVWALLRSAAVALAVLVLVDCAGMMPTAVKAWRRPQSENRFAWSVGTLASLLNVFAIGRWSAEVAAYPICALLLNGLVTAILARPGAAPALAD